MFKNNFGIDKEKILGEMKKFYTNVSEKAKDNYEANLDYFVNQMLYIFPKSLDELKDEMKKYGEKVNEEIKKFDKGNYTEIVGNFGLHNNKNKLTYIASPVKVYFERYPDDKEIANEHAFLKALKNMREFRRNYGNNYIPISAPLLFLKVYDENTEREEAFHAGLELLKKCDVFGYKAEDYVVSKGIREEYKIAIELGLEIVTF